MPGSPEAHPGLTKLVAGLYDVPESLLPALRREERRRRQKLTLLIACIAFVVVAVMGVLGAGWWSQREAAAAIDLLADLSHLLPIRTPALTPGPVSPRPLSLPNGATLPRPFFLIGADPQTRQWLETHRERLAEIHAVGMLINAESAADLEAIAAIARGLPILPASATDITQALGLEHIPVLISRRGIEQ